MRADTGREPGVQPRSRAPMAAPGPQALEGGRLVLFAPLSSALSARGLAHRL